MSTPTTKLTEKILSIEKQMADKYNVYVVICKINTCHVEAIFSSYEKAKKYMIRLNMNTSLNLIHDSGDNSITYDSLIEDIDMSDYEIICAGHIDPLKPVYKVQCGNYKSRGSVDDYLTNDLSHWKIRTTSIKSGEIDSDWIKQCTVEVDPDVPPLDLHEEDGDVNEEGLPISPYAYTADGSIVKLFNI